MSSLIMSISGMRAIVGDTMDPQLALDMGKAFGTYIGKGPVVVGGDTRVSYQMVKNAVVSGLVSVGTDVIDVGHVLTPTVQQMIRHFNAKGGMVISASHNPIQWNGIKLMNHDGSFLTPEEYDVFIAKYNQKAFQLVTWDVLGAIRIVPDAIDIHIDRILSAIDTSSIKNVNLNVLIDPDNGAGALADAKLLTKLGVKHTVINEEPNGRFTHNPEPLKENLFEIMALLKEGSYDIGFAQDADADRLVILDEKGTFIGEDYSLAYCIDYVLGLKEKENPQVVVNLSTSLVIEDVAKKHNATVHYTKIGETNVTVGIRQHDAVVGGEGNGGVIYPKVGWGRDSLVGIVLALKHLAESKKKVSETIATYPSYTMLKDKFTIQSLSEALPFLEKVKTHFSTKKLDTQDGVKVILPDAWIHVRPSNTEPIVRIFIEAPSELAGNTLLQEVKQL